MRVLRERPRVVAAKAAAVLAVLVAAALGGAGIASSGPEVPGHVQTRLDWPAGDAARAREALLAAESEQQQLRRELATMRRRADHSARRNTQLRRELRRVRQALARER